VPGAGGLRPGTGRESPLCKKRNIISLFCGYSLATHLFYSRLFSNFNMINIAEKNGTIRAYARTFGNTEVTSMKKKAENTKGNGRRADDLELYEERTEKKYRSWKKIKRIKPPHKKWG